MLIDTLRWLATVPYVNSSALGRAKILILRLPMKRRKRLLHLIMVRNPMKVVDMMKVQGIVY